MKNPVPCALKSIFQQVLVIAHLSSNPALEYTFFLSLQMTLLQMFRKTLLPSQQFYTIKLLVH